MKTTIYMLILLSYEICLAIIRVKGMNKFIRDDVTDTIIKVIPIVICVIGALGE